MEESVNVMKFAEARASEISSMMEDINYKKNKTAFQRLPPHMRRRAASHNPKRVPRKLRESYLVQNPHASTKPKKAHKKQLKRQQRKKHQKQQINYPQEYASRSRPDALWLETHIWHAKRFKMDTMYGYKLPIHSNDKKLGATHKAVAESAMLVDLSYFCCISLEGPEKKLCEQLSRLTNKAAVSHFASEKFRDGRIEGHAFLYHPDNYPYKAIGPVTFMWKPDDLISTSSDPVDSEDVRNLWIWCHPSFHNELVDVLIEIFQLTEVISDTVNEHVNSEDPKSEEKIETDDQFATKFVSKINFEKVKAKFVTKKVFSAGDIKMSLLKDKLIRFRLIGPNSYSIMARVMELGNINDLPKETAADVPNGDSDKYLSNSEIIVNGDEKSDKNHKRDLKSTDGDICFNVSKKCKLDSDCAKSEDSTKIKCKVNNSNTKSDTNGSCNKVVNCNFGSCTDEKETDVSNMKTCDKLWWQSYYATEIAKISHTKMQKIIDCLQSRHLNYYIPPGSIFGLTVRDPRLISSHKQKKTSLESDSLNAKELCDEITSDVAHSPLWYENIRNEVTATQIPECEINKERANTVSSDSVNLGNQTSMVPVILVHQKGTNGFATGWDLIAPLGWGMAFWIQLIFNGARAVGLRDINFVNLETGQPSFPISFPDTKAGVIYEEKCREEELAVFNKRPKAKRPNFSTFGIPNPFFMPWEVLIQDWKKELVHLDSDILFSNVIPSEFHHEKFTLEIDKNFFVLRQSAIQNLIKLFKLLNQVSRKNNMEDKKRIQRLKYDYNNFVISTIYTYKHLINSYVLVKVKCKRRGCPTKHSGIYMLDDCDAIKVRDAPDFLGPVEPNHTLNKNKILTTSSIVSNELCNEKSNAEKDSSLNEISSEHLERPTIQCLKDCSSRKMIGYLSEGGFSSMSGKGCGLGHCSFVGLLIMLKNCINSGLIPHVLIREQHSFQYRVCSVEMIENYL